MGNVVQGIGNKIRKAAVGAAVATLASAVGLIGMEAVAPAAASANVAMSATLFGSTIHLAHGYGDLTVAGSGFTPRGEVDVWLIDFTSNQILGFRQDHAQADGYVYEEFNNVTVGCNRNIRAIASDGPYAGQEGTFWTNLTEPFDGDPASAWADYVSPSNARIATDTLHGPDNGGYPVCGWGFPKPSGGPVTAEDYLAVFYMGNPMPQDRYSSTLVNGDGTFKVSVPGTGCLDVYELDARPAGSTPPNSRNSASASVDGSCQT